MHTIVALLGALAGACWAFTYFIRAASEGRVLVSDAFGFFRRRKWSRRADKKLIDTISDPRESAAILVYQISVYDGDVTERQRAAVTSEMAWVFQANEQTAQELFAFARMASGEINDAGNSLRKILQPVMDNCTQDERSDLIGLLERAAEVEGAPTDCQRKLIMDVRRLVAAA